MTYHMWGDKSFNWDRLNESMKFIQRECEKRTDITPIIKEKYGTIRYELVWAWHPELPMPADQRLEFFRIIHEATVAHTDVAAEIVDDFIWIFEDEDLTDQEKIFMKSFNDIIEYWETA